MANFGLYELPIKNTPFKAPKLNEYKGATSLVSTTPTSKGAGGFFDFIGSKGFSNAMAGIGAGIDIFNAFSSFSNGKKALKEQQRMNDLLERQYQTENKRYEENKKEQDEANKIIADSASLFNDNPMQRQ
ncbi:hypothetical protein B6S12_05045 [Helicobacter valdiviensis]|uniref:Uncharacterized protein n=1 Tax=Helicobacter valdiviensis TaxID=1458358 RepID=A0A2W6MY26_9HELI|nr:hypothetical protein [Helicobacter valdiviensis]PZT48188.1 hypothetical protein B6S12_05045 [Helicobacter valdiviensis]